MSLEARDHNTGRTLLMAAAASGHYSIVKELLARGADVRARDWVGRSGPVALSARYRHWDTVILLLANGGDANETDHHDLHLTPPIFYATQDNSLRAVQALLDAGATPNAERVAAQQVPMEWVAPVTKRRRRRARQSQQEDGRAGSSASSPSPSPSPY